MNARRKRKVVGIFGAVPAGIAEPQPEIVEALERLLVLAKDGQITGLLYATVSPSRHIGTAWMGAAESHCMVAAAAILQHRILSE